jgi:hypothetical protein
MSYAYSQPGNAERNFWNYYFDQPIKDVSNLELLANEMIETYPLTIWDRSYLRGGNEIITNDLLYKQDVANRFNELKKQFQGHRVLGAHVRRTDHYTTTPPVKTEKYIKEVNKRMSRFDKIFLATDDHAVARQFSELYGDKLWLNDVARSENRKALHSDEGPSDKYQVGLDALAECYALSLCTEAILTDSNLSYSALLFNPGMKYKLMEQPSTKAKRLLTLTLYYLDKWNIRKW